MNVTQVSGQFGQVLFSIGTGPIPLLQCPNGKAVAQIVQTIGMNFIESPILQNSYAIKLQGGYDCAFSSNSGWTVVTGQLTFKGGAVTVEKLKVK